MFRLEGKIFKANLMVATSIVTSDVDSGSFVRDLEQTLIGLCRSLDIPIPLWLSKNTHEFAAFHQTIFFAEQYTEPVKFDRFQIRLL